MVKFVKWGSGYVSQSTATKLSSAGISPSSSGGGSTVTGSSGKTYSGGSSDIAQKELDPVRSVDYVDAEGKGAGATTVSGRRVWSSGGSSSSNDVGSGGKVLSTTFNKPTTEKITSGARVGEETKRLAPKQTYSSEANQLNFKSDYANMTTKEKWKEVGLRYEDKSFVQRFKDKSGKGNRKWYDAFGVITGSTNALAPLGVFNPQYGRDVVPDPKFLSGGTGVYNPSTGEYDQPTQTKFEIQTEENIRNYESYNAENITKSTIKDVDSTGIKTKYETQAIDRQKYYQSKVDSGELSVKDATKSLNIEMDVINTKYQTEYGTKFQEAAAPRIKKYNELQRKNAYLGSDKYDVPSLVVTGTLIGGSVGGSLALAGGSVIGGVIATLSNTAIASEGFYQMNKGYDTVTSNPNGLFGKGSGQGWKEVGIGNLQLGFGGYAAARTGAGTVTQYRVNTLMSGGNLASQQQPFIRRFVSGNKAIDIGDSTFSKSYGYSRTVSYSRNVLGKNNLYQTSGFNLKTTVVRDAWSGKDIVFQQGRSFSGVGKLYPTQASGTTPSYFRLNENSFNLKYFNNRMDITTGSAAKSYGGTSQSIIKNADLRLSTSGKFGSFYGKTETLRFSGDNYFKDVNTVRTGFSFRKDSVSAIKIYETKAPTKFYDSGASGGIRTSFYSNSQSQVFAPQSELGTKTYVLKSFPQSQIFQPTSQVGNLPSVGSSFSAGRLVSGGLGLVGVSSIAATSLSLRDISSTGNIGVGRLTGGLANPILSKIGTTQLISVATIPKITTGSISKLTTTGLGGLGVGSAVGITGFELLPMGFRFPNIGGGIGTPRSSNVKTKAKYSYTPDYRSLVFGIKGKETKGAYGGKYSGMEVRPVTKGWLKNLGIGGSRLFKRRSKK